MAQSSFYSVNDRRLHFGIGESTSAELEIHWTSGLKEKIPAVSSGHLTVVKEGQGIFKSEQMGATRKKSP
jgi:hypothetical protein